MEMKKVEKSTEKMNKILDRWFGMCDYLSIYLSIYLSDNCTQKSDSKTNQEISVPLGTGNFLYVLKSSHI